MTNDEKISYLLFRYVHGYGDSGRESEYHCQNPAMKEGWVKLAKLIGPFLHENSGCECGQCALARSTIRKLEKGK